MLPRGRIGIEGTAIETEREAIPSDRGEIITLDRLVGTVKICLSVG
jgi:hypothetical protein